MQTIKYIIGEDHRAFVKDVQNFKINFTDASVHNYVQGRQYEDGLRQVFVDVLNEDGTPYDLTGVTVWFEGVLPDKTHKILDAKGAVIIDADTGQFRYDFPKQAFMFAGSYVQAFFRIMREGKSVTTLEFDLEVLADKVIDGLVARDYITPIEDIIDQLEGDYQKYESTMESIVDNLKQSYENDISNLHSAITKLGASVGAVQAQIDAQNIVTKGDLSSFENETESKLQEFFNSMGDGTPHFIDSLDKLKTNYPNGTTGIWVSNSDGHRYAYYDGAWQDGGVYQGTGISDEQMQKVSTFVNDQRSLIKNGDFRNVGYAPFEMLSANQTFSVMFFNQKNWLHTIGSDDTTPYKGVRYRLDLSNPELAQYGFLYWNTKLEFVIQNAAKSMHDFSIQLHLLDKDQKLLSSSDLEDFSLAPQKDYDVKTYLPVLAGLFAKAEEAQYVDICIMDNQADGVSFFVTDFKLKKSNLNGINHEQDAYFDYGNLIENGNFAKQSFTSFSVNTANGQTMAMENFNKHTWLHVVGIDGVSGLKGIYHTFDLSHSPNQRYNPTAWIGELSFLINSHAKETRNYSAFEILKDINGKTLSKIELKTVTVPSLVDYAVRLIVPSIDSVYNAPESVATVDIVIVDAKENGVDFYITDIRLCKFEEAVEDMPRKLDFDQNNLISNGNFIRNSVKPFEPNSNAQLGIMDFNGRKWLHVTGLDNTSGTIGVYTTVIDFNDAKYSNRGALTWKLKAEFDFLNNQNLINGRFNLVAVYVDKDQNVLSRYDVASFNANRQKDLAISAVIPSAERIMDKVTSAKVAQIKWVIYAENPVGVDFFITNIRITREKEYALNVDAQKAIETATRLPQIEINGDMEQITHNVSSTVTVRLNFLKKDVLAYAKIKWQGNSSLEWEKKNYKIKLYSDADLKQELKIRIKNDWYYNNEFVLKANYIDSTQARNLVGAQLAHDVTLTRDIGSVPVEQSRVGGLGQVQGFPVMVSYNGNTLGMFTFNTSKGQDMLNMDDENPDHIALEANAINAATEFKQSSAALDGTDFELDVPDAATTKIHDAWNAFMKFVNESTDEEFKAQIGEYLNLDSLNDHLILNNVIDNWDAWIKNIIFTTYNGGKKWNIVSYDFDSTFGLNWDGKAIRGADTNYWNDDNGVNANRLLLRYIPMFKDNIKERYQELRTSVLTANHIMDVYNRVIERIDPEDYDTDQARWPNQPSKDSTNYKQIQMFMMNRLKIVDNQVKAL